jgi:hypothetical protein
MILLNSPWRDQEYEFRRKRVRRFCYWAVKCLAWMALGYVVARLI